MDSTFSPTTQNYAGTYVGDFKLLTLNITTAIGTVYNIRFVQLEINTYESIYNSNITCDITINDAKDMPLNLPLFGFEDLLLEFQSPGQKIWSKVFRLVKITNRALIKERETGYILHFVTPEAINNLKSRVSKSYKGMLISDMVSDLHYNWMDGGPANIETTKYQHHIIIPDLHPCLAINFLATRANSAGYNGSNYLYYQDKNFFQFVTMESRLGLPAAKTYIFQVGNVRLDQVGYKPVDFATDVLAAQSYMFDDHSDILENLSTGMYGNELLTHSDGRKIWRRYTFDYPSSFDSYVHLYQQNKLYSNARPDLATPNSKLKLSSTGHDLDMYPFLPQAWIPVRISQLQQLNNIRVHITIPGDSERTAGEVVEFILPSAEPPINDKQIIDTYYKGRFLVASVRHKIDVDKYYTILELVKDSTFKPYP